MLSILKALRFSINSISDMQSSFVVVVGLLSFGRPNAALRASSYFVRLLRLVLILLRLSRIFVVVSFSADGYF